MNFRKVLIFVSVVFLFASCEFMNQKDAFVQELIKPETADNVNSIENEKIDSSIKTGKVILNISGTKGRMICPDSYKMKDYSDWKVSFIGSSTYTFPVEDSTSVFILPVGDYNVLVTASITSDEKEGKKEIISSIQGKSQIKVVEESDPVVCSVLMERSKTEEGIGSFEAHFKLLGYQLYGFYVEEIDKDKVGNSLHIQLKNKKSGLVHEFLYGSFLEPCYFTITESEELDEDGEYQTVFNIDVNGTSLESGFYNLKLDYYLSETDKNFNKAYVCLPDNLIEIADDKKTVSPFYTLNFEVFDGEDRYARLPIFLSNSDPSEERSLILDFSSNQSLDISDLNKKIKNYKKNVELILNSELNFNNNSFSDNAYITKVIFKKKLSVIPYEFFKNCGKLSCIEIDDYYSDWDYFEIGENAFEGCSPDLTFRIRDLESTHEKVSMALDACFGEGNYKIEIIEE